METQDTSVQKLMAVRGMGLVALPRFAGQSFTKGKKMVELGNLEGVYEDLCLVSSPRTITNPLADHLMSCKLLDFE